MVPNDRQRWRLACRPEAGSDQHSMDLRAAVDAIGLGVDAAGMQSAVDAGSPPGSEP
jgi:hypothetical protein